MFFFSRQCQIFFPQEVQYFALYQEYMRSLFPHSFATESAASLWNPASLIGEKSYSSKVLICSSLSLSKVEHPFK